MRFFHFTVRGLVMAGCLAAAAEPDAAPRLSAEQVFFVETLRKVSGSRTNEMAMDLGLDYARIKYPYGMVNLLASGQKAVEYRSRVAITDLEKILQVERLSRVKIGEHFTVVARDGRSAPAVVNSFEYLGNSPSSVLVIALLKLQAPDAALSSQRGLALRGDLKLNPASSLQLLTSEPVLPALASRLKALAVPPERLGRARTDLRLLPARLDASGKLYYFVSYWHRPYGAYELEDMQSAGFLFRAEGEQMVDLKLPADLEVNAVWDLNSDGRPEILGTAGDGARVCHRLYDWDGKGFSLIKEGLCAGY